MRYCRTDAVALLHGNCHHFSFIFKNLNSGQYIFDTDFEPVKTRALRSSLPQIMYIHYLRIFYKDNNYPFNKFSYFEISLKFAINIDFSLSRGSAVMQRSLVFL